ncbi:MAG: hypothetical protein CMN93_08015 [Synechococcus sp. CPC35]|nr:hypothetical protein [Synechococcus sp. CPC35]
MLQCRGFGPDALRQGGLLMIPLLLFNAVLSAGIERLLQWIRRKKEQPETMRMFRSELNDFGAGPGGAHLASPAWGETSFSSVQGSLQAKS